MKFRLAFGSHSYDCSNNWHSSPQSGHAVANSDALRSSRAVRLGRFQGYCEVRFSVRQRGHVAVN